MKYVEKVSLWLSAILVGSLMIWLAATGATRLSLSFLVNAPRDSGLSGGIGPILANTFLIMVTALIIAMVISLAASFAYVAAEMSGERKQRWSIAVIRQILGIGLCLPRLLWGLAGAVIFGQFLGFGISAAAGIFTLAALLIPILTTGFIEGLSNATDRYAVAGHALGYSNQQIILRLGLPKALPSFKVSVLLAAGRGLGDAAALILTAGFSARLIDSLDSSGSTLAVHIYILAVETGGGLPTAAASAFVLLSLVSLLQIAAIGLSKRIDQ